MKLITATQRKQLLKNGEDPGNPKTKPVVKIFNPCGAGTWLLSEIDPQDPDVAFGLADLGKGVPEVGAIYLPELEQYAGPLGLGLERDIHCTLDKTLSEYVDEAAFCGSIGI